MNRGRTTKEGHRSPAKDPAGTGCAESTPDHVRRVRGHGAHVARCGVRLLEWGSGGTWQGGPPGRLVVRLSWTLAALSRCAEYSSETCRVSWFAAQHGTSEAREMSPD